MSEFVFEKAEKILNSPVTGHPSRHLEERVIRLEKALREVIKESKATSCRC